MNNKKMCCFYINEIHLITMLLPYVNERIKEKTDIITVFENDFKESAKRVNLGIRGDKNEVFKKICWEKKDIENIENEEIDGKLVIVCGSDEYVERFNEYVEENHVHCEVLNCYKMFIEKEKLMEILSNHCKVVNTSGERLPEDVFTEYTQKNYI